LQLQHQTVKGSVEAHLHPNIYHPQLERSDT
jgi:hypothetical protein